MNLKLLVLGAALIGSTAFLSAPHAMADRHGDHGDGDGGGWQGGHQDHGDRGWYDRGHRWHWFAGYGPGYGYYYPPPPPAYYPPPVYYGPPVITFGITP